MDDSFCSSGSDNESPQEYTSKASIVQHEATEKARIKEIKKKKEIIKTIRKERHEKNKLQKEEKKQKLKLDVDGKLPEDFLKQVKEQKEKEIVKQNPIKKKQRKKNKQMQSDEYNDNLKVFVEVTSLDKEVEKTSPMTSKPVDFRNEMLLNNKNLKRIPSQTLRMMQLKQKFGGKNKLVT